MAFRHANKSEAKPLIGLYSESGCGKTWSALLLARGFVGPKGKIGMIETEGGRGEAYVGRAPVGDYLVRPIREVFSPQAYGEAITDAENEKLDALIIDSASHEWEGAGGVLAMAAANDSAGKKGVLIWQQPKINHQRHFMLRLMQTPIPLVIVCMRAKYPMEQTNGKEWARSKVLEPKQAADILFEMFVHGWIDQDHRFHSTKYTLPELSGIIKDNTPIDINSGRSLAAWARGETSPPPNVPEADPRYGMTGISVADFSAANDTLTEAASHGMAQLKTAWQNLDPEERNALKEKLEDHKKAAEEVDANVKPADEKKPRGRPKKEPEQAAPPALEPTAHPRPKNATEYETYMQAWLTGYTDIPSIEDRWRQDRALRGECSVVEEVFARLRTIKEKRVAELQEARTVAAP